MKIKHFKKVASLSKTEAKQSLPTDIRIVAQISEPSGGKNFKNSVEFLMDTGSDGIVLPAPLLKKLGIQLKITGESDAALANGDSVSMKESTIDLRIRTTDNQLVVLLDVPVCISDDNTPALLGMTALALLDIKISRGRLIQMIESENLDQLQDARRFTTVGNKG